MAAAILSPSRVSEFRAVIVLEDGGGGRLFPLCSQSSAPTSGHLPVANRPLISYQFELLEDVGFSEVIIVCTKAASSALSVLSQMYPTKLKCNVIEADDGMGTAEALLRLPKDFREPFILLGGDALIDETCFHRMVDLHRSREAALTVLVRCPPKPTVLKKGAKPASLPFEKTKVSKRSSETTYYIGVDNTHRRLLHYNIDMGVGDAGAGDEVIRVKKSLLRRFPNVTIHNHMEDLHVYICAPWIIDVLASHGNLQSFQDDLVPYLVKRQFRRKFLEKFTPPTEEAILVSKNSHSAPNLTGGCFAWIESESYCRRVTTPQSYMIVNQDVAASRTSFLPMEPEERRNFVHPSVKTETQIGPNSVVSEGVTIGANTSIKNSTIGQHCQIGNKVRIINSLIMDHVHVADGTTILGSIVCSNTIIAERCNISHSVVNYALQLSEKTQVTDDLKLA
eukprot:CAMPEP_0174243440 /NCGR_PEP_ID=MMETSP0417-20130205/31651_1 /TAXON_ID=242541 /ORGANISM="Mayorella sp, Strain BSH-02190019" /LENGTH=450 /DNA_ID=CAMNT_0015322963 /DNA_START=44 /DNA_END=1396 /DNA_ORIENTATION=+